MTKKAKQSRRERNTAERELRIPPSATKDVSLREVLRFWTSLEWTPNEVEGIQDLEGSYGVSFGIRDDDDPFIWGYHLGIVFQQVAQAFIERLFPDRGLNLPELKADVWEEMLRGFEEGTKSVTEKPRRFPAEAAAEKLLELAKEQAAERAAKDGEAA